MPLSKGTWFIINTNVICYLSIFLHQFIPTGDCEVTVIAILLISFNILKYNLNQNNCYGIGPLNYPYL